MMKYFVPTVLAFCCLVVSFSCKKSGAGVKGMLVAQWKYEQAGEDLNGNGVLDANEVGSIDSLNEYKLFNADGSGQDIGALFGNYPIPFYWNLSANNQYLGLEDTNATHVAYYLIDAISSTQLILRDTAKPVTWTIFKRSQ